jgi:hypothetical protein
LKKERERGRERESARGERSEGTDNEGANGDEYATRQPQRMKSHRISSDPPGFERWKKEKEREMKNENKNKRRL